MDSKTYKILLVEDEEDVKDGWVNLLNSKRKQKLFLKENESIIISWAEDGDKALEKIKEVPPDLVISDLMMERVDGRTLMLELRKIDPTIPIMIVTGRGDEMKAVDLMELGVFSYLKKDMFREDSTFIKIKNALEAKELKIRLMQFQEKISMSLNKMHSFIKSAESKKQVEGLLIYNELDSQLSIFFNLLESMNNKIVKVKEFAHIMDSIIFNQLKSSGFSPRLNMEIEELVGNLTKIFTILE